MTKQSAVPTAKDAQASNAVSKISGGALASYEHLASDGAGAFEITKEDIAIPFLTILQALSPMCTQGDPDFDETARAGMLTNTVTKELMLGAVAVPVFYKRSFIEWVPRKQGGGFRGEFGMEREIEFNKLLDRETGKAKLQNGNDLVDTRSFYVLAGETRFVSDEASGEVTGLDYSNLQPMVISMASTQIKQAKTWVNLVQTYVPLGAPKKQYDAWAATYKLGATLQKNDKGSWFGWKIGRVGPTTDVGTVEMARAFRAQIAAGVIVVDREQQENVVGGGGTNEM